METKTKYPFTRQQFDLLRDDQKQALDSVAEYLTGDSPAADHTDESLSETFNLLKPFPGCVPNEELGDELAATIRKKFCAIYQVGLELAEQQLKHQGKKDLEDFSFCIVVQPDCEDATHVVILDYKKPCCYLHEWHKAWNLHFEHLAALADEVIRVKDLLVQKVNLNCTKQDLYIVLEGGLVREVIDLPAGYQVIVVDYDVEDKDREVLDISPIDGELCHMTSF